MDDPLLTYLVEALNLVHPRFAGPDRAAFVREFYHQLRRLWDKALPVQLGLGHVLIRSDPDGAADLVFWRLGEGGAPDRRLGAVTVTADHPEAVTVGVETYAGPAVIRYDTRTRTASAVDAPPPRRGDG